MKYDSYKHRRWSIRLRGYNYTRPGRYFVTICTRDKENLFGEISDGVMQINEYGRIAQQEWLRTRELRSNVRLDQFVVMPNHIHGIIVITPRDNVKNMGNGCRGVARYAPTGASTGNISAGSLPAIARAYKSAVAKRINELLGTRGAPVWQRNYYEHIIRNDAEWNSVSEYISTNPLCWEQDEENPDMHNPY